MNLLVKNEADIIADNVHFHATQGVDCFVIMDNGSTDGTREIIDALSKQYEMIVIDRPTLDYQQSNWKTEMACRSRKDLGASWSIANDADEFWVCNESISSLKEELSDWGSILQCKRVNMIPDQRFFDNASDYLDFPFEVKSPLLNKHHDIIHDDAFSVALCNINGKVMVNNKGLLRVKGGNHRAWHCWGFVNQRQSQAITVYHYPIRSRENFISHIENRAKLLAKGVSKMGDHYRRWVRLLNEGRIEQELERLALLPTDAETLLKFGIVQRNDHVGQLIKTKLGR